MTVSSLDKYRELLAAILGPSLAEFTNDVEAGDAAIERFKNIESERNRFAYETARLNSEIGSLKHHLSIAHKALNQVVAKNKDGK